MDNKTTDGYEFEGFIRTFEQIVLDQLYKITQAASSREYEEADLMMDVLAALLGETKEYRAAMEVLNEEYNTTKGRLSKNDIEQMGKELHKNYVLEHMGIIRELLKSKKYIALIQKTDVLL